MSDADILRAQVPTSTDPARLEREASFLENMTLKLPDPSQSSLSFCAATGTILTIKPDGKIELGAGLNNDEATAAFIDCLSRYLPTFLMELRQRTERAEATAEDAKRHIEALTGFYMDNVLWTRAAEEARAFGRSITRVTDRGDVESVPLAEFTGVSG